MSDDASLGADELLRKIHLLDVLVVLFERPLAVGLAVDPADVLAVPRQLAQPVQVRPRAVTALRTAPSAARREEADKEVPAPP